MLKLLFSRSRFTKNNKMLCLILNFNILNTFEDTFVGYELNKLYTLPKIIGRVDISDWNCLQKSIGIIMDNKSEYKK